MAYDFSFDTRQWWATIVACVLVVLLAFAAGFVAGMMWGRRSAPQTQATGRAAGRNHEETKTHEDHEEEQKRLFLFV